MQHRARVIGSTLDIRRGENGGTAVTCTIPEAHLGTTDDEEA